MNALATALYTRSQVAGNFKTSINGKFYLSKTPQSVAYPYVVYHILSERPEYYLFSKTISSHNFENINISMNIHSNSDSASEALTILDYLKTHFDDCDLTVSGWNDIKIERTDVLGPFYDDQIPEWIISVSYNVILQKS